MTTSRENRHKKHKNARALPSCDIGGRRDAATPVDLRVSNLTGMALPPKTFKAPRSGRKMSQEARDALALPHKKFYEGE